MKTKTCRACHMPRPLERFYAAKASPDGLQNICRACRVVRMAEFHKKQRANIEEMRQAWLNGNDGDKFTNRGMRQVSASFASGLASVIDQIGQYQARRAASGATPPQRGP